MTTLNFNFRTYTYSTTGQQRNLVTVGATEFLINLYPNHNEIFCLHGNDPKGGEAYVLYQHRIANGIWSMSDPTDYNFGFFSGGVLHIRHTQTDTDQTIHPFNNTAWNNSLWSLSNASDFRSEIANFLASSIASARILVTGSGPAAFFNDWAVQILLNQTPTANRTFVIFYPGNDPMATHTLTRTI